MTTVKGWIFLLQLFPLSADLAKSHFFNLPSSSSPPSPHFLWTVTRKPFRAPRLQPRTGKYFNRSPFDKWLEIRLEAHITFENKCLNLWVTKFLGCQLLYTASSPWTNIDVKRNPTSYKPHTSWILYTCISDQWKQWILRFFLKQPWQCKLYRALLFWGTHSLGNCCRQSIMAGPTGTTISGKPQIILYHRNNLLSTQPNPSRPMTLESSKILKI